MPQRNWTTTIQENIYHNYEDVKDVLHSVPCYMVFESSGAFHVIN